MSEELNLENVDNKKNELPETNFDHINISELIMHNTLGESLSFTRTNLELNPAKQYKEVISNRSTVASKTVQGALPFLASAQTIAGISKQAPFGLFTATVDPAATLSKLTADGSFSTMVREGGKIVKHAGFEKVSISPANAFILVGAAMQAMAIVSGQYYMHRINSQLTAIGELVNFHHDEKIANLLTTKERLEKISNNSLNDISDLNEIRNLLDDTRNVFYEYKTRLQREHSELMILNYRTRITKHNTKELTSKLDRMNFTYQMCYESDKLSLQVELVEIAIQMKLGYSVDQLKEKISHLKENYNDSFYFQAKSEVAKLYKSIRAKAATKETPKTIARYKNILEKKNMLEEKIDFIDTKDVFERMLTEYDRPREILYVPGDDSIEEKVYILEENNNEQERLQV